MRHGSEENPSRTPWRTNLSLFYIRKYAQRLTESGKGKRDQKAKSIIVIENGTASAHAEEGVQPTRTMVQNSIKMGYLISQFPTCLRVKERARRRANERSGAHKRSEQCGASKSMSGASERAKWPSTYVPNFSELSHRAMG